MDTQVDKSEITELLEFKKKIAEILQRPFCSTQGLVRFAEQDVKFLRDSFFTLRDALIKERMLSITNNDNDDKKALAERQLSKEFPRIFYTEDY